MVQAKILQPGLFCIPSLTHRERKKRERLERDFREEKNKTPHQISPPSFNRNFGSSLSLLLPRSSSLELFPPIPITPIETLLVPIQNERFRSIPIPGTPLEDEIRSSPRSNLPRPIPNPAHFPPIRSVLAAS